MATITPQDAAQYAYNAGFRGQDLQNIVAIAGAESTYQTDVVNPSGHYGILQFDAPTAQSVGFNVQDFLVNPQDAFTAAFRLVYGYQGQSGRGFQPWETYTNGAYQGFLATAANAIASVLGGAGSGSVPVLGGVENAGSGVLHLVESGWSGVTGIPGDVGGAVTGAVGSAFQAVLGPIETGVKSLASYVLVLGGILVVGYFLLKSLSGSGPAQAIASSKAMRPSVAKAAAEAA